MDEKTLLKKIAELLEVFNEKSSVKCKKFAELVQDSQAPRNSHGFFLDALIVAFLEETLDYFRTCAKYQVFDLEATRRENVYLRKLLEKPL